MDDELRFVNAFIGFCTPLGNTWPAPLLSLAYNVVGIEREFQTWLGGRPRTVVPELIVASEAVNHVICLEAKSSSLSIDQARRYLAVTGQNLLVSGFLPAKMQPSGLSHDVLYIASPDNVASLADSMKNSSISLPVLVGGENRFALFDGTISQPAVEAIFVSGIAILPQHSWPTHFVLFNKHTPAEKLSASVASSLAAFVMRADRFSTRDVAERAIPHWHLYGQQEQSAFLNKVHTIVDQAQREELNPFFKPERAPKGVKSARRILWEPLGKRPMSTNAILALQRLSNKFVSRQETGTPYKKDQPALPGLS
jgi:hypothetical protein